MSDLARLRIWDDQAIRGALSWYLDVAENRRPAKFRIRRDGRHAAGSVGVFCRPALALLRGYQKFSASAKSESRRAAAMPTVTLYGSSARAV
jgi:hypothetical protein